MEFVRFEKKGNVGVVTLDRPPLNAFNKQMYLELAEAFQLVADDKEIRVVLLRAEGEKFFSAGNDVHDFADSDPNDTGYIEAVNAGVGAVFFCVKPVICACNGTAAGAGFSAVLGSDIVFSVEKAKFGMPEIKVGVIGGAPEASYSLPNNVVKYMVLTGETLSAADLYRIGFIHELVAPEELYDKAFALAEKMSKYPPIALKYAKQSLKNVFQLDTVINDYAAYDRARTAEHKLHPDFKEAAKAFLEKREPHYIGE